MPYYEEITLLEKVESKRVYNDLFHLGMKQLTANLIALGIIVTFFIIFYLAANLSTAISFALLASFSSFFSINLYYSAAKAPLKKLYKIAKHNDLVRHDEMIRARERKRLLKETAPQIPHRKIQKINVERTLNEIDKQQ